MLRWMGSVSLCLREGTLRGHTLHPTIEELKETDLTPDYVEGLCTFLFHLGRLSEPRVTVGFDNSREGGCNVSLTCSVEKAGLDVTHSWLSWEHSPETLRQSVRALPSAHPGDLGTMPSPIPAGPPTPSAAPVPA